MYVNAVGIPWVLAFDVYLLGDEDALLFMNVGLELLGFVLSQLPISP